MKKNIICGIVIITLIFLGVIIYNTTKDTVSSTTKSLASKSGINKINFPAIGGDIPNDMNFTLAKDISFSDEKIKPGMTNKTDKIFEYKISTNNDEKLVKLKKIFKLENANKIIRDKYSLLENENSSIRFNEDGTFIYHSKKKDDIKENKLSDNEVSIIAKKFLKENDLLSQGFSESNVSYETVESATDPSNSKVLRKSIFFNRDINGNKTYGVSRIIVSVGQDSEITDLYYATRDISDSKEIKIKDFNTAYSEVKKLKGLLTVEGDAKDVIIKKVTLSYWEDSSPNSNQKHVQPIYIFTGDTTNESGKKGAYSQIVSAVPDELTEQIEDTSASLESTIKVPKNNN